MLPSKSSTYATLKSSTFRAYPLGGTGQTAFFLHVLDRYGGVGGEGEAGLCARSCDTIITITVKNSSQKIIGIIMITIVDMDNSQVYLSVVLSVEGSNNCSIMNLYSFLLTSLTSDNSCCSL